MSTDHKTLAGYSLVLSVGPALLWPAPALARSEFDAMADGFFLMGVALIYLVLLLGVGVACGVLARCQPRSWHRLFAKGALAIQAVAMVGMFVFGTWLGARNGPFGEAMLLGLLLLVPSPPSFFLAWRLHRQRS
jgi:hypothetical protein